MTVEITATQSRLKLPQTVIVRAPGLLPMMYRTRELVQELGVSRWTVVHWTQQGAPHERDGRGHIWIHGQLFASWVQSHRRSRARPKLPADQAYCLRCNELVTIQDPEPRRVGNMILLGGNCPECGARVNRAKPNG